MFCFFIQEGQSFSLNIYRFQSRMKEFRIFPEFQISHVIKLILQILKFEKYFTRKYRDRYIKMIRDQKTVQYQQINSD